MQKTSGARRTVRRKTGKRTELGPREKRRLTQLGLCAALFFAVLLGRGIAPEGMLRSGERLLEIIQSDTDFKSAFSALGEAVSQGKPVLETLGDLAVEVFGAGGREEDTSGARVSGPAVQAARQAAAQRPTEQVMLFRLGVARPAEEPGGAEDVSSQTPGPSPQPEPDPSPTPQIPAYTGPDLPEGATMEYVDLGLEDTVTPVMGVVTSAYGYRDHPVSGEYHFHKGTDLAADMGTPIAAFADGTVEFIGESDDGYGLYIQLDHGNGVTSFYSHCSALYFHKGEKVSKGQTIALVGDTGNATGPHLHLELRRDGVLLNPVYYIETAD